MTAALLQPGAGERISDQPARSLVVKGEHELVDVTECRFGPGEGGADPHVHRTHGDAFYVLEGELALRLGAAGERVLAPAGTLVLVPAGVIHSFANDGPAMARFLNFHAPSASFADYLRAARAGDAAAVARFDQHDPPADGGRPVADVVVRAPGEGAVFAMGESRALLKAEGSDGDGTLSLLETTLAPGFPGPVAHVHERMVDSFYVLEGTLTLLLGDDELEALAGSFAFVPPGVVHTFANRSGAPVRMLVTMAPGGFEQYLKEVAAAVTAGSPLDQALMAKIASAYDFRPA